ncbi:FAD-dependent oxidoreductase [Rhodococcus hoagii]|nr:FAD-dependent oxidoreductase [Prescottella equi]
MCTAFELSRAGATVGGPRGPPCGFGDDRSNDGEDLASAGHQAVADRRALPHGRRTRAYVEANRDGRRRLLDLCRSFEVPVQRETAYTYATSSEGATALAAEFDAATEAGLDVGWDEAAELPFPVTGAIGLADQAQFDPVDLVTALVRELRGRGVPVVENTRVRSVGRTRAALPSATTVGASSWPTGWSSRPEHVLDRGSFFARLEPQRSYCIAVAGTDQPPRGMYLSADSLRGRYATRPPRTAIC